ncbi:MAG: YihY/virulence factor BrkB family protein [bacterium]
MVHFKKAYDFLRQTINHLIEDEGYRIAAEASFYLIFSIFPLLFLFFTAIGFFQFGFLETSSQTDVSRILSTHLPDVTLETFIENLDSMTENYKGKDIVFAIILFLWPASNVFYAYADAVGMAYGIPDRRGYIRSRLLSVALLFGAGFIIFLTSFLFGLMPLVFRWMGHFSPLGLPRSVLELARYLGAFALITPCVAMIYYFGPDSESRSELEIWPGAIFATLLWILFSQLFGFYLRYIDTYRALYGTLGGAMLLLLWMYLTSLAIVFGAEFNYTWLKNNT